VVTTLSYWLIRKRLRFSEAKNGSIDRLRAVFQN